MDFVLSLVFSILTAFTLITSLLFCANISLWNYISKQVHQIPFFKRNNNNNNKNTNEIASETSNAKKEEPINAEISPIERIDINKMYSTTIENKTESQKVKGSPKPAEDPNMRKRLSLLSPTSSYYSNTESASNYSVSTNTSDCSTSSSESEQSSAESVIDVSKIKFKSQEQNKNGRKLRRVKSELKVPKILIECDEDSNTTTKPSIFSSIFNKSTPPSPTRSTENITSASFQASNGNILQPNDSINFHIPKRFDKQKSNVTKTSMQGYTLNVNQLNKDEYGSDIENKSVLSSNAVNLYDKRRRSVLSFQDEALSTNNEDPTVSTATKLKFSIFNDKPLNLIKFHLISIIDLNYICKYFDKHFDLKFKKSTENLNESLNTNLVEASINQNKQFLDVNYSVLNLKNAYKKTKGTRLTEFYIKLNFDIYHSDEAGKTASVESTPAPARRRFSDAFMEKLNIKAFNSKKVLENHSSFKTKIFKYTSESRSISIDQVFIYSNLINNTEKKDKSDTEFSLEPLDEEQAEDSSKNKSYADLFKSFKNKFFIVKISLHDASTKKKLGKIEVFLDFMNLNLNPFNIFMQDFIPIDNIDLEEENNLSNTTNALKMSTLTPEICDTVKKSCDMELLVSMQYISQTEQININLMKFKASNQNIMLNSLKKCYFYCKISMYVMRNPYKKKYTKFHKINSKNKSIADKINILKSDLQTKNSTVVYELNETFSFDCTMNKFDQIYFNIDLNVTPSKKFQSQKLGKIVIGSINYCTNIKGFTQMEQMLRSSGNEVPIWHKFC